MKDRDEWFLNWLMKNNNSEDVQQIAGFLYSLKKITKERQELSQQVSFLSAMIADICEQMFGPQANGSPRFMCTEHGGWACSPFIKRSTSFVRASLPDDGVTPISKETLESLDQWEEFIKTIGRRT